MGNLTSMIFMCVIPVVCVTRKEGAPTSNIIAEFFLQHLEDTHLTHISRRHNIVAYFRYVDDILLIYDSHHTDTNKMANDFNNIHPNLRFTTETESDCRLNFLDITLHRMPHNWVISIHRKSTFTDTIIPYTSNHPTQHKYAAIRFLHNRLNTYHLQDEKYKEEGTIRDILSNKAYIGQTGRTLQKGIKNTNMPSNPTTMPQTTQNMSQNTHTHLDPSRTRCKSYSSKAKETTSTRLKDSTFIPNSQNKTI
jgi:hypothetical protein